MAEPRKYRVVLSGAVLPEKPRAEVLDNLAALFHSRRATMEKLLRGQPVALTKEYSRDQAREICRAIREAGAECAMEEVGAPDSPSGEGLAGAVDVADTADTTDTSDTAGNGQGVAESTRPCPQCRGAVAADARRCRHCGFDFADRSRQSRAGHSDSDPAAAQPPPDGSPKDPPKDSPKDDAASAPRAEGEEAALLRFVGVNAEYYRRQFAKFGGVARPAFAVSWHWPAFFVFFFWATYRKMWLWAGVKLAGDLFLALTVKPGIVYLAWALCWPLAANYLYFRHARSRVLAEAGADYDRDPDRDHDRHRAAGGGVSRPAVGVAVLLMFMFSIALNSPISERMLERYAAHMDGLLPPDEVAPGSRQRGDGSVIEDPAALDAPTRETLLTMKVLGMALTRAAAKLTPDERRSALALLEGKMRRKPVADAWGTAIALRRDAIQFALVSAGPDRRFGNADDLLQYLHFDDL